MALITFAQLTAYPGFDDATEAGTAALLESASALVQLEADPVELTPETLPPALAPIIVGMVRRGLHNPMGKTSEQLGDYMYQVGGGAASLYLTREERRIVRRAVGRPNVGAIILETPIPTYGAGTDLLGGE